MIPTLRSALVCALLAALAGCSAFPTAGMGPDGAPVATSGLAAADATRARGALVGEVRSPIVAAGGMNLVARGGGHVLVANGRQLVAAGGGNVVGNGGGTIVAAGGLNGKGQLGGIVAAGGLNYRLAQAIAAPDELAEVPVEGATVFLRDALTLAVVEGVAPATTDATGAFAFPDLPLDTAYVVEAVALADAGEGVRLTAVARAQAADAPRSPVAVGVASTLVAARVAQAAGETRGGVYQLDPGAVADAVRAVHEQLRADRVELRAAAEGVKVKTTGKVADAAVAADYRPDDFAGSAGASERVEGKAARARTRVGKVRHAVDPAVAAPTAAEEAAATADEKNGGNGGSGGKKPPAPASTAPAPDASAPPEAPADAKPGKPAAPTAPAAGTADGSTTGKGGGKASGSTSGSTSSGGGKGAGKPKYRATK